VLLAFCPFIFLLYEFKLFRKDKLRLVPSLVFLVTTVTLILGRDFGLVSFFSSEMAVWTLSIVIYYTFLLIKKDVKREVSRSLLFFSLAASLSLLGLFNGLSVLIFLLIGICALLFKKGESGLVALALVLLVLQSLLLKLVSLYGLEPFSLQFGDSNLVRAYIVSALLILSKALLAAIGMKTLANFQSSRFDVDLILFFVVCAAGQIIMRFSGLPLFGPDTQYLLFFLFFLLFWLFFSPTQQSLFLFLATAPDTKAPVIIFLFISLSVILKRLPTEKVIKVFSRETIVIVFAIITAYSIADSPSIPRFALCSTAWILLDKLLRHSDSKEAF